MLKFGHFNATKEALRQYLEGGDYSHSFVIAGRDGIGKHSMLRQLAQSYDFDFIQHSLCKDTVEECTYDILRCDQKQEKKPLKPLVHILDIEADGLLRTLLIAGIEVHLMKFYINEWYEWASASFTRLGKLKRKVISTSESGKTEIDAETEGGKFSKAIFDKICSFVENRNEEQELLNDCAKMVSFQYRNHILEGDVLPFWNNVLTELNQINIIDWDEMFGDDGDEKIIPYAEKLEVHQRVKEYVENIIEHVSDYFYATGVVLASESGSPNEILYRAQEKVLSQESWIKSLLDKDRSSEKVPIYDPYADYEIEREEEIEAEGTDEASKDNNYDIHSSQSLLEVSELLYSSKVFEIKKFKMQEWLRLHPDKTDRDWLLETRCQSEEQREKIRELFNWVDTTKNTLKIGHPWKLDGFGTVFSDFALNDVPFDLEAPISPKTAIDPEDESWYYLTWLLPYFGVGEENEIPTKKSEIVAFFARNIILEDRNCLWKERYINWYKTMQSTRRFDKEHDSKEDSEVKDSPLCQVTKLSKQLEFLTENELKNIIVDAVFDEKCRKLMICWCTSHEVEDNYKEYVGKDINNLIYNYPYIFETVSCLMSDDMDRKGDRVVVIEKIDRAWGTNPIRFNEVSNIHQERNANIILLCSIEDRSYIPHSFLKGFEQFILLK